MPSNCTARGLLPKLWGSAGMGSRYRSFSLSSVRSPVVVVPICSPRSSPPAFLERYRREVKGEAEVHLPDRLMPSLGGEYMMLQYLDISDVAFQRATRANPARANHAVHHLHRRRRACCRVGQSEQEVSFLTQRMGLSG